MNAQNAERARGGFDAQFATPEERADYFRTLSERGHAGRAAKAAKRAQVVDELRAIQARIAGLADAFS